MKKWKIGITSERGPRSENQDNYLVIDPRGRYQHLLNETPHQGQLPSWPEHHVRIAVADGMGGHEQGREFTEVLIASLLTIPFQTHPPSLKAALEEIHENLFQEYFQNRKSPGCTLVMADITSNEQAVIANIGDSRVYLTDPPAMPVPITHDHTEAEFAWRAGLISSGELEQLKSEQKPQMAQAIGFGHIQLIPGKSNTSQPRKEHQSSLSLELSGEHPDIFSFQIEPGQVLELMTDGWWDSDSKDNKTRVKLTRQIPVTEMGIPQPPGAASYRQDTPDG